MNKLIKLFKFLSVILTFIAAPFVLAAEDDQTYFLYQQRQKQIEQQLTTSSDVHLAQPTSPIGLSIPIKETPCVKVQQIRLNEHTPNEFHFLPQQLMKQTAFQAGMCLGSQGINVIQTVAQNLLISKGYITSRIVIEPQDLTTGVLLLTVYPGRIGQLHYHAREGKEDQTGRIAAFANKFPVRTGKVLNLRDLEHGLENLRRLPSVQTDIQIEPAEQEGYSDIQVSWEQTFPFHFSLGIDDAGNKTTGKYQGHITLSADNPLGLSDLLYLSYSRDLGHKASYTDLEGKHTGSGTYAYSVHYSFPINQWLLSWNHHGSRYHEATEGLTTNYDYNGKNYHTNLNVSRMVFRSMAHKTTVTAKLWAQQIEKYLDDTEIEVQRRRMAGWAADIHHRAQLGRINLSGRLAYKRGTGMKSSMAAPEEFNEYNDIIPGTSRMKIITADIGIAVPAQIGTQLFSLDSEIHAQWNKTPLVPQDKLSIGGRYTVRGFDGEQNLTGERGWYWQNNINWHYLPHHQVYWGMDSGHVSGQSTEGLAKKRLWGAVVGLKGKQKFGGTIDYDVFIAKALSQPDYFKKQQPTYGFKLHYHF